MFSGRPKLATASQPPTSVGALFPRSTDHQRQLTLAVTVS